MKPLVAIAAAIAVFSLSFLAGFILHIALTNARLRSRGLDPRDVLGE